VPASSGGFSNIRVFSVFNVILYEPEIPPNTGNIIRLCANTGAHLHLVEPLGFDLDESSVKRAGLDYHVLAEISRYPDWNTFHQRNPLMRIWAFSTHGTTRYDHAKFQLNDGLLFGSETRGLPADLLSSAGATRVLRLPMRSESRSMNLSNTVAVALFEALRQTGFSTLL
jgi:tRNA (cytidine/uridine-2'-O-)-methyltransferase